ncbi:MAG: polysaccharide deacetylase family protein, partial [Bacteroidota bacterium]
MILMYHNIGPAPAANTVAIDAFAAQMAHLADPASGYAVQDFAAYTAQLDGRQRQRKALTVTFDDAYIHVAAMALPVLEQHQIPVTVFVPVGHVGGHNAWDTAQGAAEIRIMDWAALRELAGHPLVTLGVHSWSHPSMGQLPEADLGREIGEAKAELEQQIGGEAAFFAYPYGQLKDVGSVVAKAVQAAGFQAACTTIWGGDNGEAQRFLLRRLDITPEDSLLDFRKKLEKRRHSRFVRQRLKN